MGADADIDAIFGIGRARGAARVVELLGDIAAGIRKPREQRGVVELGDFNRRALADEDRVLLPDRDNLLARLHGREVDLDRPAGRKRPGIRIHLVDQLSGERGGPYRGGESRRNVKEIAATTFG
jgi:hypothetical protein